MGVRFCPGCAELPEASHQACPHCGRSLEGMPVIEVQTAKVPANLGPSRPHDTDVERRADVPRRAHTPARPIPSSPSRPRDPHPPAGPAVVAARGTVRPSDRRRKRLAWFVAVGAALALAVGLIGWALTERSTAAKWRSDSRSSERRASDLSHQLKATTRHLRDSTATVGSLNNEVASLAAQKARLAVEHQRLRRIVAAAAKARNTAAAAKARNTAAASRRGQVFVARGCLDSSSDFADARVVGTPNTLDNVDFYVTVDGTCGGGVRPGGHETMVIAGTEADAVKICEPLGATRNHSRFASFGYPVPSTWQLCV